MADKDKHDDLEDAAPAPSKLPMILSAVSVVGVLGIGAMVALRPAAHATSASDSKEGGEHGGGEGGEHHAASSEVGPTVHPPDFVVRLRNPEVDRYVRLGMEIEVGSDKDKEIVTARMPQIRDVVISYLADRTLEDLRGSEGLNQLKDSLKKQISGLMPNVKINGVYITDFVSQ